MNDRILELLERAVRRRRPLKARTNAIRLVNSVGDGLEDLLLDQYGRHFCAQIFHERWLAHKEWLTTFVRERLGGEYLVVKDRTVSPLSRPDAFKTSVWIGHAPSTTVVHEHGLRFGVDLNDGLNSGLFLDMRANRKLVGEMSQGKRVLNAFAYTCSFGVHCQAAGASSVTNVDISQKSLERGRKNYALNHITPVRNEFIRANAVEYCERALRIDNRFGLIVLDPPSFARHDGKVFTVKRDLASLVGTAWKLLHPGGAIFVATNFTGMTPKDLEAMVASSAAHRAIKRIRRLGQDRDFVGTGRSPESYLAAILVES